MIDMIQPLVDTPEPNTPYTLKSHINDAALPEEIQEVLIDCINDQRTLLSCRLVCSRWLVRTRQWLFHNATIAVPGSDTKDSDIESSQKLIKLLQSPYSTLGPSIRKITVIGPDSVPCTCCETIGYGNSASYGPLSEALEASLPLIPHARDLSLQRFVFSKLNERARAQLAALSHVVSLKYYGVTFSSLTDMLAPYPNIKALQVDGVLVWDRANDDDELTEGTISPVFHPLTALTSLSMTVADNSIVLLSSPKFFRPQGIVSLSFATLCKQRYISIMAQFIVATGTSLEHLTLDLQHYDYDNSQITLADNSRLKTLTLKSRLGGCEWCNPIISTARYGTQITIQTWFEFTGQTVDEWRCPDLEALVSQHADRKVALKFWVRKELQTLASLRSFNEEMERRFPEQVRQGSLHLEFV